MNIKIRILIIHTNQPGSGEKYQKIGMTVRLLVAKMKII